MASKKPRKPKPRRQEVPRTPDPPTTTADALLCAHEASRAMRFAAMDLDGERVFVRAQAHLRNFLSNAASVTFLLKRLKGTEGAVAYDRWWTPIEQKLGQDPLAQLFWRLRTESMKRASPVLSFRGVFLEDERPPEGIWPDGPWVRIHRYCADGVVRAALCLPDGTLGPVVGGRQSLQASAPIIVPRTPLALVLRDAPDPFKGVPLPALADRHASGVELILLSAFKSFAPTLVPPFHYVEGVQRRWVEMEEDRSRYTHWLNGPIEAHESEEDVK